MNDKTITILGAGYVGLTTAALLAHAGFTVYAIEPNPDRLNVIKQGRSFFYEEGLDPIIKTALEKGSLVATNSYKDSVPHSKYVISCVGTPDNPDGSSNLAFVYSAAKETAQYIENGAIYIQKSTVPVGTGAQIEQLFSSLHKNIHYVSNPEFLREGTALYDTLFFDRIVAGGNDVKAAEDVIAIYRRLEDYRDSIAEIAGVTLTKENHGRYISTSLNSAELIKVTANAFLALKISFANSIAKLSDKVGADIVEVMDAVGADHRIGNSFLNAGRGYGGGCFPKDVSGLIASGLEHGVDLEMMQAARSINESMPGYILEKLQTSLGGSLVDKRITILGLAFKAGTSDVRRSPSITLANAANDRGAVVSTYDPHIPDTKVDGLDGAITRAVSIEKALQSSDTVIVATDWSEFLHYPLDDYARYLGGKKIFVDAVNRFSPLAVQDAGLVYIGVGRAG